MENSTNHFRWFQSKDKLPKLPRKWHWNGLSGAGMEGILLIVVEEGVVENSRNCC